jgi:hypothetical protein
VLEVRHQPGEKGADAFLSGVCTLLSGRHEVKVTMPDDKTVEKDRKAGEVQFSEPVTRALENIGTTEQHGLVIELRK